MSTEKDISDLSTHFDGKTQANGKINFGICINKRIKEILHWVQYFYRVSGDNTVIDLNEVILIQQLDTDM